MVLTAYCMKCRTKREIRDPEAIVHPNGRAAVTGVCSVCGTKVFRMGKMPESASTAEKPTARPSRGKRSKVKLS